MLYIFLIIIIFSILYIINSLLSVENFYVTTWTPYIIDKEYQPGYTNYFYNNGYMYPIF